MQTDKALEKRIRGNWDLVAKLLASLDWSPEVRAEILGKASPAPAAEPAQKN
jgi:hypothetical protein